MEKQYVFNEQINNELDKFEKYLQTKKIGEDGIKNKLNYAGIFLQFLENEALKTNEVKYPEILAFIEKLSQENKSKRLINIILLSVRNYYDFLKTTDQSTENPAFGVHLKGVIRKIPENIISFEKLEETYKNYPTNNLREKRNKIILGLLVYQAITTDELMKLTTKNLVLEKAKIRIDGNQKRVGRTLDLQGFQIIGIYEYIFKIRPEILNEIHKEKPGRKPDKTDLEQINNQLFISLNGNTNIKPSLNALFRELPGIDNAKQIRRSAIVHRLKSHNLREVQYFAGHKYISSTEPYLLNNIEDLKNQTEKYHPLNEL